MNREHQSFASVTSTRVAFFCPRIEGGGAERVMTLLARELGLSLEVDFLVARTFADEARHLLSERVNVVELEDRQRVFASLVAYLHRRRPRALLSTLVAPNVMAVAAARTMPRRDRPRVVVREAHLPSAVLPYRSRLERRLVPTAMKVAYPRADAVVALTDAARDDLRRLLGPRAVLCTIHNPVDLTAYAPGDALPIAHPWLRPEARASTPVVLAMGRLVPKKGFDVLLRAVAILRRTREVRLLLLGEGPERARLVALARTLGIDGSVAMPGFVHAPRAFLERADVFALSSHAEGMPNVLLEALACGTPIVATDCPSGPREILDGLPAVLVAPGDAPGLAHAMGEVLAAPPDRTLFREAARKYALPSVARAYRRVLLGDDGVRE